MSDNNKKTLLLVLSNAIMIMIHTRARTGVGGGVRYRSKRCKGNETSRTELETTGS